MKATALVGLLLLGGCVAAPPAVTPPEAAPFTLDANGIQPAGTPLRIDFSRAEAGVIETVSRLRGTPPAEIAVQHDCGAGPVTAATWEDGLTLNFLDGDFRGWVVTGEGFRTATGLAVGQPRDLIQGASFTDTTLGTEFQAGGTSGLLNETGTEIAALWSGVTCFSR